MSSVQLMSPNLENGLRSINFFNGRLLSGEDLSQEQAANLAAHKRLGRAIGDGIAYGLEVTTTTGVNTTTTPTVTVQPGLAINRCGQTLALSNGVDVSLVQPTAGTTSASADAFGDCRPLQPGVYIAGAGVYLLLMAPAAGAEGRAQVSGLTNVTAACNARYRLEGVQFRLVQLGPKASLSDVNHLRNRVAYECFGTDDPRSQSFLSNPFGPRVDSYGLLDDLRPNCLTDCDVPLAVIHWTTAGIQFVDMWSVRRRIIRPVGSSDWPLLMGDRWQCETEAMFLQFRAQIEELLDLGLAPSQVVATDRFDYLPPVGLLPISTSKVMRGFDYSVFFSRMTYRKPIFIEGAQLRSLLREALDYPPINTSSGLVVWLYLVRENAQASLSSANLAPAYLVFASGHTPYRGEARYDVHHWNFGNFS